MTAIAPTVEVVKENILLIVSWAATTESDTNTAFTFVGCPKRIEMETYGTWGSATFKATGSNGGDGGPCHDLAGAEISETADVCAAVGSRPRTINPIFSGGTSQSLQTKMAVWL